jgi:hypothetical protein
MDEVGERSRRNVVAYLNAGRLLANQTFRRRQSCWPSQSRMQANVNTPASMPKIVSMSPMARSSNLDPIKPPIMALASIPNNHIPKVRMSPL